MVATEDEATSSPLAASASRMASARTAVSHFRESPVSGKFAYILACPVSYDEFKKATEAELQPMRVHEGTLGKIFIADDDDSTLTPVLAFMFESSMQVTITDYAIKRSGKLHGKRASDSDARWTLTVAS